MGLNQPRVKASNEQIMGLRQEVSNYVVANSLELLRSSPVFQRRYGLENLNGLLFIKDDGMKMLGIWWLLCLSGYWVVTLLFFSL
jgi:hypothetical protein